MPTSMSRLWLPVSPRSLLAPSASSSASLLKKQNVAHLVALAFAVASSGNLPVVFLSLFWRKFNTAGVISGLVIGTIASIGLVMVSPNMTYPKVVAAGAQKVITAMEKKQAALPPGAALSENDAKGMASAKADFEKNKDGTVHDGS